MIILRSIVARVWKFSCKMDLTSPMGDDRLEVNRRPGTKSCMTKMPNNEEIHIAYALIERYKTPSQYLNLMYAFDFALGWDEKTYKVTLKVFAGDEVIVRELPMRIGSMEGMNQVAANYAKWKQLLLKNNK